MDCLDCSEGHKGRWFAFLGPKLCGCERQRDAKSSSATDAHPKESTKQWRQFASIGESSHSRTQFSPVAWACLPPSLCPSQTLHWRSVSPFPLCHGPRFPGNITSLWFSSESWLAALHVAFPMRVPKASHLEAEPSIWNLLASLTCL